MSRGARHVAFASAAVLLSIGIGYLLVEVVVQGVARTGGISEYVDLRSFEENPFTSDSARDGRHWSGLDRELGWLQGVLVSGASEGVAAAGPTVLFLGDSVTYGELATRGEDDYVTRVGDAVAEVGARVVNAGASGYGLDQMMLRLPREIDAWSPSLVVAAYIPHDLRRVGRTRFIRMAKPFVDLAGPGLRVTLPEDDHAFYARQADAVSGLRYGVWLFAERLRQRRYELPGLHLAWYEAVLDRIANRMAEDAGQAGAELVFVEIPNFADAPSSELLAPIMRGVLEAGAARGAYRFATLDACLRARAAPAPWPTDEFAAPHPGPAGHADLAACMLGEVVGPALGGGS